MKRGYLGLLLIFGLFYIGSQNVDAASLSDETAQLQARRIEIEKRANELNKTRRDLEQKTSTLEQGWSTCANGRWQLIWKSTVDRSNDARKELETQRMQLFALNKQLGDHNFELDQKRRQLEHDFRTKSFEYETAFRLYMHSLESEYLERIVNEYFFGVDKYLSGIKSYQAFLSYATQACSNNDIAPQTLELGLKHVKLILEAVKSLKDILKVA